MQTSAWRPPIRIPKFNQHWIKLSRDEGMGSITHKVKGIIVLDCIEMRSRKLCWFYTRSVCKLYVCTSCTVCPAVLYRCLTPTPPPQSGLFPSTPKLHSLVQDAGKSGLEPLEVIQFSLFALLLCEYAITWFVKCYVLHKITAKNSAYLIPLIGQSKQGKKLPEHLIHLICIFWKVFLQFL